MGDTKFHDFRQFTNVNMFKCVDCGKPDAYILGIEDAIAKVKLLWGQSDESLILTLSLKELKKCRGWFDNKFSRGVD